MTTIAADAALGVMVCDSQIADGDQKWSCVKVERINGDLYGTSGEASEGDKFYDWIRRGKRGGKPKVSDEFSALALDKTGLYLYDAKLYPMRLDGPFGIGTGGKAARALMKVGIDIERAVAVAIEVDAGSGGAVVVHHLDASK
jgi:hypothetical protein